MKRLISVLAVLGVATLGLAACNRSPSSTAMNNSGTSAMPGSNTSSSTTTPAGSPGATGATSTPTTTDTAANTSTANTAAGAPGSTSSNAPAASGVNDTVTTGKIKAALASDSGLKDTDISVSTNNGVVSLSGSVKSQDQVSIATNLAQRQEGVQRVESNLTVK
jgi:hyperosmotically inducible protein